MKKLHLLKRLFLLCLLVMTGTVSAQQTFNSAEEKIVYNKSKGLPKYEGVIIEYSYVLKKNENIEDSDLQKIKAFFPDAVKFRLESENGRILFYILTEGDRNNHDRYNEALAKHPDIIEKGKRNYILK